MKVPNYFTTIKELHDFVIEKKPKILVMERKCKLRKIPEFNPVNIKGRFFGYWINFAGIPIKYKKV